MPRALKIVLTALIALAGAIWVPIAFMVGLQPLRNLFWDLSYLLPGWMITPLLVAGGLVGLTVLLVIPALAIWLIWRRGE